MLYPMKAPNRRKERRPEFLHRLFMFRRYTNVFDLTRHEEAPEPKFLEGTGSLVLDRVHRCVLPFSLLIVFSFVAME